MFSKFNSWISTSKSQSIRAIYFEQKDLFVNFRLVIESHYWYRPGYRQALKLIYDNGTHDSGHLFTLAKQLLQTDKELPYSQYSCMLISKVRDKRAWCKHWTGLLDWTPGLDSWTGLLDFDFWIFLFFRYWIALTILSIAIFLLNKTQLLWSSLIPVTPILVINTVYIQSFSKRLSTE